LTDVEIRFRETSNEPEFTGQQRTSMSLFVCGLRRIEKLKFVGSLDVLDQAAFEHLATLSTLKSLNAERLHDFTPFKSSHFSDTPGFLGLRSLKILVTTFEVVKFIKFLYGAPLAEIEMIIRSSTTPPELFRAIAESVPPMALRSLTMSIIHSRLDRMPPVALQGGRVVHGGLPQLFCFYNITTVDLFLPDELDLDDVFVFQMARAWPHLRSLKLRLYPESGFADDSLITLAVYPVFAHHCPELRSLDIEISALVIPLTDYDSTPHQAIRSKVAWLDVGTAPIDDPSAVASLIFTVFPAVSEIRTGWKNSVRWSRDELDRFRARWKEVEKALTQKRRTSSS
jgi:hypothetical protein